MTAHLTVFQRDLARRLRAEGMSLRDVAREVGCSHSGIDVVLRGGQAREARAEAWTPRDGSLQAAEREEILLGLQRNESTSAIARAGQVAVDSDEGGQSKRRGCQIVCVSGLA